VGDFVCVGGVTGTVKELGLFGCTLTTPDDVMTLVGNGKIFSDTVQNFSTLPVRRVDRTAQPATSVDPLDAIARLKAAVNLIPNISKDMPPEVNLLDLKAEGPVISVRPYTHTDHYWQVYFDTNEAIVRVCKEAGWPVPGLVQITKVVQG
jgi:small conductance mechanosensitive channel